MANTIWFDMDGTIYPLYKQENWLERLRNEDDSVFVAPAARNSLPRIRKAIRNLIETGWTVGVITWAPMDVPSNSDFFNRVRNAKMAWLNWYFPEIEMENFFCLEYGTPKAEIIPAENGNVHVLIDDNKIVRAEWRACGRNYITIDANKSFCKELEGMVM